MKQGISGTVAWNQGGVGVDHAAVYLFRIDHQAKELVEALRTIVRDADASRFRCADRRTIDRIK